MEETPVITCLKNVLESGFIETEIINNYEKIENTKYTYDGGTNLSSESNKQDEDLKFRNLINDMDDGSLALALAFLISKTRAKTASNIYETDDLSRPEYESVKNELDNLGKKVSNSIRSRKLLSCVRRLCLDYINENEEF